MGIDPITAAIVGGGVSVLGGIFGSDAAKDAAQTQADSTLAATQLKIQADKDAAALVSQNSLAAAKIQEDLAHQASMVLQDEVRRFGDLRARGATDEVLAQAAARLRAAEDKASIARQMADDIFERANIQGDATLATRTEQGDTIARLANEQADAVAYNTTAHANVVNDAATNESDVVKVATAQQAADYLAAAQAQSGSINRATTDATAIQREMLDKGLAYNDPYIAAGTNALGKLQAKIDAGPGEFTKSPGYAFRLAEGQKAIDRQGSMGGSVLSGAQIKAQGRFAEDYATNDYDNFLARYYQSLTPLEKLTSSGSSAANANANLAANAGTNMSNTIYQGGVTSANALAGGIQGAAGIRSEGEISAADILASGQVDASKIITTGATDAAKLRAAGQYEAANLLASGKLTREELIAQGGTKFWEILSAGEYDAIADRATAADLTAEAARTYIDETANWNQQIADLEARRITDVGGYRAAGLTSSTNALAGGITSAGNANANAIANAGNANAAGIINSTNAITGGINSGVNNALMTYNMFKNPNSGTTTSGANTAYGVDYGYDPSLFQSTIFTGAN